jgi:type IV secretory pathway component VirB8
MEASEYASLEKLTDRELFDFVTEKESSQRRWAAMHLLEMRRNEAMVKAAKSSASAAWLAALIAGISAVIAILALKGVW